MSETYHDEKLKVNRRLVDTKEAARLFNTTPRTIRRWVEAGKIEGEFVNTGKGYGKGGQILKVWIDDPDGVQSQTPQGKDRYKIHRGEPGCRVVTPLINGIPQSTPACVKTSAGRESIAQNNNEKKLTGDGRGDLISVGQLAVPSNRESPQLNLPMVIEKNLPILNPKLQREGYLKFAILRAWREKVSENHKPKGQTTKDFLEMYNSGQLLPDIYNDIGSIKKSALNNWDRAERLGGVPALVPQYRSPDASPITEDEQYILLNCLLHQNQIKIGSAIKFTKAFLAYKKTPSPSSEYKLRRFADEFRRTRYDAWVKAREGAKALNDKCVPYAEREWRDLQVGDAVVADGHRLNFQVISPFTGKKCRATIVLFWDWKSSYPLGWEIMLEESTQCIASALRNAILTLGKIPKWLLIDNGKAFKAKVFTSEVELEDGILYGMFATLGIHTHFSQAYNPQEKPLERFWGTFNNWFERLLPSYSGASIKDKPAYMRRNEKDAQARHNKWVPRIEEVQELLHNWRKFYANQPSRGRDGMRPGEIFEAEKGPGVDPGELYHLMMAKEKMQVHRNGVTFNGWHYYDEAFYGIKDYVVGKYSLSDFSEIYCFYKNRFLCVAKPIEKVYPMASESEYPKDQEAKKRMASLKHRVRRGTKNLLTLIESGQGSDLGDSFRKSPEVAEVVKAIENKRKPIKVVSLSTQEEIEHFEIQVDEGGPLQFDSFSERYEFLLKKGSPTDSEKMWIHQFETGEIAPGEWELIYGTKGGGDASQVYRY